MANVRVRWVDSLSAAATGTKVYRNDVEIADIANGVQEYIDTAAPDDATPKYEVQAHDGAGDETTQEVLGENMDYIDTTVIPPTGMGLYAFDSDITTDKILTTFDLGTLTGDFTAFIRIKFDGTKLNEMKTIISSDGNTSFTIRMHSANNTMQIQLDNGVDAPVSRYFNVGDGDFNDNSWHNFTVSYSVSAGQIKFYKDASNEYSPTGYTYTGQLVSRAMWIGNNAFDEALDAELQVIQLYNRVLTDGEVLSLETDVDSVSSGKVADYNSVKSTTVWTENISGANGSVAPSIAYVP